MSRRARKASDADGDRSHIPREERSFLEYHPTLPTNRRLHIVRQAAASHRRSHSQSQPASVVNGLSPVSSVNKSANTNAPPDLGITNGHSRQVNGIVTPTASEISHELTDVTNGDGFAFRRQLMPNDALDTSHDLLHGDPVDVFGAAIDPIRPEFRSGGEVQLIDSSAIDPALFEDNDEIAAPSDSTRSITYDPDLASRVRASFSSQNSTTAAPAPTPPRNGSNRGSVAVAPSDRFLRSEVSVEEKYERLRREEGFSIGKLHEPKFRKLDSSISSHKVRLTSNAIAFGYQADRRYEHSEFCYVRAVDVPEAQLADRVEYDMDEQDDAWLTDYNERRRTRDEDPVSAEVFEITLTKIEKEWTSLEKLLPRPERKEEASSEDAKCAVCDDGECENTNAIVFCDGCNLAVHQDCYGVPYIPEGQWLCRKCFASPMDPVQCLFCPSTTGAFKQTSDLHWAHLLCTNWIPEVTVGNPVFMEPIEGVSNIPSSRWKLVCYICKLRVGACIQCSNKNCYTSFHVSCARRAKLFLQHNPSNVHAAGKAFCDKHVPDWYRVGIDLDSTMIEAHNYFSTNNDLDSQTLTNGTKGRFTISLKKSKQSAVIPAIVFADVMGYMQKFRIRNKAAYIADMCKYWSLKRRSRRGQSLLKRLQLQIEDVAANKTEDEHKAQKLAFGKALLAELDDYHRVLLEEIMEREATKKERSDLRDSVIELIYLPLQPAFNEAIKAIQAVDTHSILHSTCERVRECSSDLQHCVSWVRVIENVANAQYLSVAMFETDLTSLVENIADAFPEASSREHKLARKLQERIPGILQTCHEKERARALNPTNMVATSFDEDFLPDGLTLTEAKPWNWANRDASPLSDLDDDDVADLKGDLDLDVTTDDGPASKSQNRTPVAKSKKAANHLGPESKLSSAPSMARSTPRICRGCRERRVRCNGTADVCSKNPKGPKFNPSSLDFESKDSTSSNTSSKLRKPEKQSYSEPPRRHGRLRRSVALEESNQKSKAADFASETIDSTPTQTRSSRSAARSLAFAASGKRKSDSEHVETPTSKRTRRGA